MNKVASLPPLASSTPIETVETTFLSTAQLPQGRAHAYITVFEDAIEQLSVLSDITPEAMKTDNKQVSSTYSN